jgi:hypothetical protein
VCSAPNLVKATNKIDVLWLDTAAHLLLSVDTRLHVCILGKDQVIDLLYMARQLTPEKGPRKDGVLACIPAHGLKVLVREAHEVWILPICTPALACHGAILFGKLLKVASVQLSLQLRDVWCLGIY